MFGISESVLSWKKGVRLPGIPVVSEEGGKGAHHSLRSNVDYIHAGRSQRSQEAAVPGCVSALIHPESENRRSLGIEITIGDERKECLYEKPRVSGIRC